MPIDGRFEHIVLSCNATADHAIIWIEREAQKALDVSVVKLFNNGFILVMDSENKVLQLMLEKERIMELPVTQRMERQQTLAREHSEEHKAALRRAVTLSVPDAYSPSVYGTFDENLSRVTGEVSTSSSTRSRMSWDELIERVFEKDDSGQMVPRKSPPSART